MKLTTSGKISYIGLCIIFLAAYIQHKWHENLYESCQKETKAIIVFIKTNDKRGNTAKYKYIIDNKTYYYYESIGRDSPLFIGDTVDIIYTCEDHNISNFKE